VYLALVPQLKSQSSPFLEPTSTKQISSLNILDYRYHGMWLRFVLFVIVF